jgi:hypothetical protein
MLALVLDCAATVAVVRTTRNMDGYCIRAVVGCRLGMLLDYISLKDRVGREAVERY